ncbi:MAG: hypothetical protein CTY20_13310 [Hyphomicrobium sp.]|nr:MAG: hypothetical protein CTY20_13310 [Hyphomicrobium sp.]
MTKAKTPNASPAQDADQLRSRLQQLAKDDSPATLHMGARLRNYFLTGLLIVGPVTITIYIIWWLINVIDAWIKPFVPKIYNPDTYLPFALPGIGLLFAIVVLTMIGALAANLLGRTLISYGELMLSRMPIVRNVYRAMKQIFESVVTAATPNSAFQKVGLIEFPSKGLWSVVFVTGETAGEIAAAAPGGETDLLTVFMPTGIVPPTGFVCFVPRKDVIFLTMKMEDAAKVVISGGMVTPEFVKAGAPGNAAGAPLDVPEEIVAAFEAAARAQLPAANPTNETPPPSQVSKRSSRLRR